MALDFEKSMAMFAQASPDLQTGEPLLRLGLGVFRAGRLGHGARQDAAGFFRAGRRWLWAGFWRLRGFGRFCCAFAAFICLAALKVSKAGADGFGMEGAAKVHLEWWTEWRDSWEVQPTCWTLSEGHFPFISTRIP